MTSHRIPLCIRQAVLTGLAGKLPGIQCLLLFLIVCAGSVCGAESGNVRTSVSLNGEWHFRRDEAASNEWKTVVIPSSFQSHEGTNFHGVGWYRRRLNSLELPPGKRLLLSFEAAATEAQVWWNGERLGSHLGGWTPFRFDVTDLVRRSPNGPHEILVRLDEKVGHNTQGFLPIIAPHFGGIWQGVSLLTVPETYVDDLRLMAIGDAVTGDLHLEVPLEGTGVDSLSNLSVRVRERGEPGWKELPLSVERAVGSLKANARLSGARPWSPADPVLYELEITLPGTGGDRVLTRAGFRSIAAFGPELRLNGQPLSVRGVLNWGYSAPRVEPNAGEAVWRAELEHAMANGFNLMKYCLWVPPKRYLELADELGVLTWMEYPTWHPALTGEFLEPLRTEFREFFAFDRNHPSVVLRSLTCETGPSAELKVVQSLYDAAHKMIPGALVEDDSSWIQWNRVHDFYDDHPYGNNHTWVETLTGFNEYILGHGIKPLVLGESMAADTWVDRAAAIQKLGRDRPWWAPGVLDDMGRWTAQMRQIAGEDGLPELLPDSLRYGMLMRKYQVEAFRREIPYGGYVISVLRDIPNASMGLLDYEGRAKWRMDDWQWQRETMCLLKTDQDRRSFRSGETLRADVLLSHFGTQTLTAGTLRVALDEWGTQSGEGHGTAGPQHSILRTNITQKPGTLGKLAELEWSLPKSEVPRHLVVRVALESPAVKYENCWPIWLVPSRVVELDDVELHSSLAAPTAKELFPSCGLFAGSNNPRIVIASRFDEGLARFVEQGGKVLLLPDGQRHSFALQSHWFLRGAPYIPNHSLSAQVPRDLLLELQHFDLAGPVVPELPHLECFAPILMLWDTHDLQRVKTHGLVFETRVGKGRLLVSALRHGGETNPAGAWLLGLFLEHLRSGKASQKTLSPEVWEYAKARLNAEQTNLVNCNWRFRPDPDNQGLVRGWQKESLEDEATWKEIKVGAWWESQGYPALDKWAWYRLHVDIPQRWRGHDVFLSFEGVDDCYELYINGQLAGTGGDLATRKDALDEKKSHDITRLVQPGRSALIAVRVYDWYGAGGIFRPVTLGTLALNPKLDLLQ